MKMLLLGMAMLLAWPPTSRANEADDYPNKMIRLIMPFPPGGTADALARPLVEKLGAAFGQPVIIEYRAGAQTVIGASMVAKSSPDGYTLYFMVGAHVLTPFLVKKVPYDPVKDFTPVAFLSSQGYVISTNSEQPFKTLPEMIAYAKQNFGKVSIGAAEAISRVASETLKSMAGVEMTVVNFKGGGEVATAVLGNHISSAMLAPGLYNQLVTDPRMRGIAVTSASRAASMPDIPTAAEAAGLKGYEFGTFFGLLAPAGLPPAILNRLQREIANALSDPAVVKVMNMQAMSPPKDSSPAFTAKAMESYQRKMGKAIVDAGIKPE
jgi:tripartite-type tricarboxylate transporter receptor subunit TctC